MKFSSGFGWGVGGGDSYSNLSEYKCNLHKVFTNFLQSISSLITYFVRSNCLTTVCLVCLQKNEKINPKRQYDYFSNLCMMHHFSNLCMMHPVGVTLEYIMFSITRNRHSQKIELGATTNTVTHLLQ
jgi:hypothetical protein